VPQWGSTVDMEFAGRLPRVRWEYGGINSGAVSSVDFLSHMVIIQCSATESVLIHHRLFGGAAILQVI
jgi:hypothetical protein